MSKLLWISSVAVALLAASVTRAQDGADVAKKEAAAPIRVDVQDEKAVPGELEENVLKILLGGQPIEQKLGELQLDLTAEPVQPGEYWLGVQVGLPGNDLRSKLKLPEDQGLVVENVVPDSPAAKGGIKAHDLLMKAGDTPLKKLQDLIEAVQNAKDKPLSIQLLRDGKEEKVAVTPAKRPAGVIPGMPVPLPGNPEWDKVLKWLERAQAEGVEGEGKEGHPLRFHIFRPGAIVPHDVVKFVGLPALPDDMTVTVTKTGKKPAEIVVQQGEEKWEATETDLSNLPEKARPFVEHALGRVPFNVRILGGGPGMTVPAPPPAVVAPGMAPRLEGRLEKRVEEMGKRLDRLDNLIQQLQENQAKHEKTPKESKDSKEKEESK